MHLIKLTCISEFLTPSIKLCFLKNILFSISTRGSLPLCQEWYRPQDLGHPLLQSLPQGNCCLPFLYFGLSENESFVLNMLFQCCLVHPSYLVSAMPMYMEGLSLGHWPMVKYGEMPQFWCLQSFFVQDPPGTNYGTGLRAKTAQQMCDRWDLILFLAFWHTSPFAGRRPHLSTISSSMNLMIE